MTVTIWNPALNEGGGGVHIHVEVTGFDMSDPENPVPIEESTTLTKQVGRCWTRRGWPKPVRIDPNRDVGNTNPDLTGLIILDDMTTPASIPADQKRGPDRETPLVDIEAGTATWWLLVDMTEQEINGVSEQKKAQLKQSVNQERDRRWPGTVNCDLAGDGSLVIPADARNDTDLRNIQAVTTTAQVVAGTPDAVLKFRDANDVTHNLSPEEVIALGLIVQAHVQSFYEKAWALKDSIDSMTSVELDAIDVRNNSHWGITNVSSSADSI
jgi:hypothetical protein